MARTASQAQIDALESLDRVTRLYLEAYDGSTWIDLSAYMDEQWVTRASWGETTDRTVIRVSMELQRETPNGSLVPLVQPTPLLEETTPMRLAVEVNERGGASTGRVELCEGRIHKLQWGGDKSVMTVDFRDGVMGRISHASIDEEYPIAGGALSTSVQELIDEFAAGLILDAQSDPPGTFPADHEVPAGTVLDGIYHLVDQTGWEIRRKWIDSESDFGLVIFEPDDPSEGTPTPVLTLTARNYYEISEAGLSSANVRDRIVVRWSSLDGETEGKVTAQTPSPIFGTEYRTEIFDVRTSPLIITEAAAQTFASKALLTLGRAPTGYKVVLPFDWRPEIGDWVQIAGDDIHSMAAIEGAVHGIDNRLVPGEEGASETVLTLAGSYGGRVSRWNLLSERTRLRQEIEDVTGEDPATPALGGCPAWYLTTKDGDAGFSEESTPETSLGRYASTTEHTEADVLFRDLTDQERLDGITLYRSLALVQPHGSMTWDGIRTWLESAATGYTFSIALDPEGVVDLTRADPQGGESADEETEPVPISGSLTWVSPADIASGAVAGTFPPETTLIVHQRMVAAADASSGDVGGSVCAAQCEPSPGGA